ncbi:DNA invertase Pin-like site-specific DNA recombinase [Methylobacterium brachiatum]|uniref:DNA invertase Pin-like site-specific DNA recombinase n=1 Tax=Methylobacterium brachiatum TaxID=269660 RepID=A0AAJ1TWH5_9HYPH|nr:recombinase family protein [Methylobacterium brachiatum]MCB4805160.1 recombinase family protein [Methylobacterium brachiatum]MDQ0546094.1 DNA invertase Pin-like site-specific DNA recombinase [Methylobacterium brachiatum]
MSTILYARVSTAEQTLAHQQTQAEAAGFVFDAVVADHGESGRKPLRERPEGRRLYDMLRTGDVLVVRWINRLGRSYEDVTGVMRELMQRGVIVRTIISNMTFDGATRDPMQRAIRDALIAFMAAAGEAELEATREAQRAGIDHARAKAEQTAYRGRKPSYTRDQLTVISGMLGQGAGVAAVARETGLTRQTIYRVQADPVEAEAALARWA